MDGGQWLTVKEFAAAAGVSIQAVYQRLEKGLNVYLKTENGRKYVHSDALQFVGIKADSSAIQASDSSSIKALERQQPDAVKALNAQLDSLTAELTAIRAQLHAAELAAAAADARAAAETKRADDNAAALRSALDAVTAAQQHAETLAAALTAAQALHAGTIRGQLDTAAADAADGQSADIQQRKRGFFSRIFRRK